MYVCVKEPLQGVFKVVKTKPDIRLTISPMRNKTDSLTDGSERGVERKQKSPTCVRAVVYRLSDGWMLTERGAGGGGGGGDRMYRKKGTEDRWRAGEEERREPVIYQCVFVGGNVSVR